MSLPPLRRSGGMHGVTRQGMHLDATKISQLLIFLLIPEPQLDACSDSSPMRRMRKAELMACVLGHSPGSQGASTSLLLDLELTEQQLVRPYSCHASVNSHTPDMQAAQADSWCMHVSCLQAIKQQHRSGKKMLERWVDDVLTYSQGQQQQVHTSQGTVRGAAAAGLARQQLLAAGLAAGTVEQLYRCLYVYSMGFVDTIKVRNAEASSRG